MKGKKIIFPTDFSHFSDTALEFATIMARDSGGELVIVHVEEPPVSYSVGEIYYGTVAPDREELERMLHAIRPSDLSVSYEHRLLWGDKSAADQIVDLANAERADLLVIGSHGRTGVRRLLLGSVAEAILRRASCPVMVIKQSCEQPAVAP